MCCRRPCSCANRCALRRKANDRPGARRRRRQRRRLDRRTSRAGTDRRRRQRGALRRGKGANAAVAAARAGAAVRYCGAVGRDDAGSGAVAELRTEGIDVTDVATLDGVSTGTALIVVDRKGENQIAVGAGANAAVDPAAVRTAVARAAGWAGCVLVSAEVTPDAVVAAVESAASHRIPCVLNPAPVTSGLVELFGLGPVLTPNSSS
ncbi:PfkB family carbohydrate kinase [Pseudonocardia sp. T1-2H]|uniref:PfkB family carbohydrate kinase n=1 Tax=Pseudonocardia sp. T1-2H TaxID=3128899 RepID=UPI00310178CB